MPVTPERQRNCGKRGVKQRHRNTTAAVDIESPRNATFVCEVPLRSGFYYLEQSSSPEADSIGRFGPPKPDRQGKDSRSPQPTNERVRACL